MWPETLDWTVCNVAAAAEKLPESAIATRAANCRRSTWPVWLGGRSGRDPGPPPCRWAPAAATDVLSAYLPQPSGLPTVVGWQTRPGPVGNVALRLAAGI